MQEEVVKYMSKLPGYLERGECQQDKPINFGVLDWGRVEQWQTDQTLKSCQLSPMDRSSHPQNDSVFRRFTLQHHLLSSPASFRKQKTFPNDSRSASPSKFLSNRISSSSIVQMKTKVKNTVDELVLKRNKSQDGEELGDAIGKKLSFLGEIPKPAAQGGRVANPRIDDSKREKRSTSPFRRGMSIISKPFESHESPSCEKQSGASRARSSPLRRLIDPLFKSKETVKNPKHKQSPKSDTFSSCGSSGESEIASDKRRSFSSQALLRVALRNGQPLFTLAVDNEPNILAATLKKITNSSKMEIGSLYTFFSIREMKSKNGRWMSQGDRGKSHDYLPDVVAQMKISTTHNLCFNGKDAIQFVLSDVKLRKSNAQELDFQPNNELAAVVLSARNPNQTTVNVILPSGIHSLPDNGGPSSLIQRWKTGGSCDCGGWDIGCKLKVANNLGKNSESPANKFDLFVEGSEEEGAVFRLTPFKDGIYSVAFESSFSIIQAFSVCIAIIEGNKMVDEPESSKKSTDASDTLWSRHCEEVQAQRRAERKVPARLVSFPPISPVGRA